MTDAPTKTPGASRRRRWRRTLAFCAVALSALVLVTAGGVYAITGRLTGNVERIPAVFAALDPAQRPAPTGATTFLLVGRDAQADGESPATSSHRADAIMLARLDAGRTQAAVVSIPRDSWVAVPGHGMDKINAAYAYGGPTLLVQTVEDLTGVRIDHFATIDFAGFQSIVDAVGGIDVDVARRTADGPTVFAAGIDHLDGTRTLAYVRQRKNLPRGDLDRVHRQQNVLRALLTKAASAGVLNDPARLYRLLDTVTSAVGLDDTLSDADLVALFSSLGNLGPGHITFMTAPVAGTGREGAQSVVNLDTNLGPKLWQAVTNDDVRGYLAQNGGDTLGDSPR